MTNRSLSYVGAKVQQVFGCSKCKKADSEESAHSIYYRGLVVLIDEIYYDFYHYIFLFRAAFGNHERERN